MSVERRRISLRNATEIKVKNLLNLLSCIVLAQCCTEFLSRWKNVPCPRFFLRVTRTDCLLSENVFVAVSVDYLFIDCYGADPDRRIFRCLQQTEDLNLVMRNCYSRNFSLSEFLSGLVIRNLQIAFTKIEPNYQTLHIEKLPFVRNVSLSGIRTAGTFDLTFDFQPVIYSLQIFEYNFTSFHQPPFKNLTNLPILKIVYGNLQRVQTELLQELRNLRILTLYNNRLRDIPRGFFKNLTLLTYLDLSDNQIENFSEDIFSDLFSLEILRIKNNKLTVLPENLLSSLAQLIGLEISGNTGIKNLPKGFLRGLTHLELFWASGCSLVRLEESLFSDTTSLIDFFVDFNNITRLPEALFNNTEHLSRLFMTGNKLSTLPPRVFSNLKRIGSLDLSYNRLNSLHKDIFKRLSTLAVLRLSDNDLSSLHEDTLLPLLNLRIIDLSNNNFERLPAKYPFGSSNYLQNVKMSNSNLKTFPNIDWSNNNLTEVDLSHNQFRQVTLPVFTKKRTKILLNHNNISTIYIDYRRHSNSYPVYNVTGNVIECDCRIRQFLRFLHFDKNAVRIFPNSNILRCNGDSEKKLTEIWPIYSVCPRKEECPLFCECYLTLEGQSTIDCSRRNLSNSPANLPTNATFVFLNDNHIANLSEVDGTTWKNVTHLYLSNNSLTSLNDWVVPDNLLYLALDGNKLSDLPPSVMKRVEDSSNFSIFLSRNEWKCDCHSVHFKKWFTRNLLKIRDSENVTCQRVNRVNNSVTHELIASIPLDVFCLKEPVWPLWQIIVLTVSVVLLLMSSVLVVACYHYRLAILAFLYSRDVYLPCCYRVLDEEENKYDAFVCYNSSDSNLTMEMVDRLEPTYRLCIHERDWLAGSPISENIVHSVLNSRRTVILLSRQFLDSMWFSVEFRVAYNRMMEDQAYRLVLVLVEDLENWKELEDDLRRLLSTRTYLKWGEKWFWEKLKYILRKQ
ncbi:protein toll-like [Centruroides sculpturatus]|uniref:protein toll-like n=1 Tax=Centruroides sculpturatus TaxID=218467 RepID=UPI000C6E7C1F|nr:protein toll-like [Centruroides sculpturatus]